MNVTKLLMTLATTATLTACGATASHYRPIVDGEINANYEHDLASCKPVAEQKRYTNDDVKTESAVGAAVGAVVGVGGGAEGAIGGALVGGLLSGGERAWETRDERKNIIIECMKQRGHRVVG